MSQARDMFCSITLLSCGRERVSKHILMGNIPDGSGPSMIQHAVLHARHQRHVAVRASASVSTPHALSVAVVELPAPCETPAQPANDQVWTTSRPVCSDLCTGPCVDPTKNLLDGMTTSCPLGTEFRQTNRAAVPGKAT